MSDNQEPTKAEIDIKLIELMIIEARERCKSCPFYSGGEAGCDEDECTGRG